MSLPEPRGWFGQPGGLPQDLPLMTGRIKPEELGETPFYVEPVMGWRCWRLGWQDDQLTLQSVTYSTYWIPMQELTAQCKSYVVFGGSRNCATVPNREHRCGIYAVKTPKAAMKWAGSSWLTALAPRVVGRVKLWGRILCHTEGWLAQHAYPASFFVPETIRPAADWPLEAEEVMRMLEDMYRVPTVLGWPE